MTRAGQEWRSGYVAFRARGYQIGSGAMESLHRTGSQLRLKLPGAKWLSRTSQAIFNIRMMRLAGNWKPAISPLVASRSSGPSGVFLPSLMGHRPRLFWTGAAKN